MCRRCKRRKGRLIFRASLEGGPAFAAFHGAVYAKFWAAIQNDLTHPELLETPPEKVLYAPGCEYHVPKVQKA